MYLYKDREVFVRMYVKQIGVWGYILVILGV